MPEQLIQILLAEDNPADVYLIRAALEAQNIPMNLQVVSDGEKAVRLIEATELDGALSPPDLLLLDLNLPCKSGNEVLKRVRTSPRLEGVPVIIVSSSTSPKEIAGTLEQGANHFFCKPSDYEEYMALGQVVENVLEQKRSKEGREASA